MAEAGPTRSPRRQDLADERRAQIIAAAKEGFSRRGFHQTSMDHIAAQAGISVGQIYRHFSSKNDIIRAIVETTVADRQAFFERLTHDLSNFISLSEERPPDPEGADPLEAGLTLEIAAEASRNPAVAALVEWADRETRQSIQRMFERARPHWDDDKRGARMEIIASLFEARALRAFQNPGGYTAGVVALRSRILEALLNDRL